MWCGEEGGREMEALQPHRAKRAFAPMTRKKETKKKDAHASPLFPTNAPHNHRKKEQQSWGVSPRRTRMREAGRLTRSWKRRIGFFLPPLRFMFAVAGPTRPAWTCPPALSIAPRRPCGLGSRVFRRPGHAKSLTFSLPPFHTGSKNKSLRWQWPPKRRPRSRSWPATAAPRRRRVALAR